MTCQGVLLWLSPGPAMKFFRYTGRVAAVFLLVIGSVSVALGQTATARSAPELQSARSGSNPAKAFKPLKTSFPELAGAPVLRVAPPLREEIERLRNHRATENQFRFPVGTGVAVTASPVNNGRWVRHVGPLGDSDVWSLQLHSEGAVALRLHFSRFDLPPGARLQTYSASSPSVGAEYSGQGPFGDASFWSPVLPAEDALINLISPSDGPAPQFVIDSLQYLFASPVERESASACNLDLACFPDWTTTGQSVARIAFVDAGESFLCSGSLLNNDANDHSAIFATAGHCVANESTANSVEAFWLYQAATCNGVPPSLLSVPATNGASMLSVSGVDQSLLLLLGALPSGVTWAGWTTADPALGDQIISIHHPHADYKRISFGTRAADEPSLPGFIGVDWNKGILEPGSSGGPGFNVSHLVIGQVSRGTSSCTNPVGPDFLGSMSAGFSQLNADGLEDFLLNGLPEDALAPNQSRDRAASLPVPSDVTTLAVRKDAEDWLKITIPPYSRSNIYFSSPQSMFKAGASMEIYVGAEATPRDAVFSGSYAYRTDDAAVDLFLHVRSVQGYSHYQLSIDQTLASAPLATTGDSRQFGDVGNVDLRGTVQPNLAKTEAWFEYGTDPTMQTFTATEHTTYVPTDGSASSAFVELAGLQAGTTYYYRVAASNHFGSAYGDTVSFTTPALVRTAQLCGLSWCDPPASSFPDTPINFASPSTPIMLGRTGNSRFTISSYTLSGPFKVVYSDCALKVPIDICRIDVAFSPVATGIQSGTLSFVDDTTNGPHSTSFSATAILAPVGSLDNQSLMWLDPILIGTATAPLVSHLRNVGSGPLHVRGFAATNSYGASSFILSSDCPASLLPAQVCTITAKFAAVHAGPIESGFRILDDSFFFGPGDDLSQQVYASGIGYDIALSATRPSRNSRTGSAQSPLSFVLTASAPADVTLSCITDAPGATCEVPGLVHAGSRGLELPVRIMTSARNAIRLLHANAARGTPPGSYSAFVTASSRGGSRVIQVPFTVR
jgi:hypothetical protein